MNHTQKQPIFALCSVAAAMLVASQGAFAHTRLEVATVPEGTRTRNAVLVSHGCPPATARKASYGTTAVFPNAVSYSPIIGVDSGAGKVYTTKPAADFYSPLSGIAVAINGGGAWPLGNLKVDPAGNKDGFWAGGQYYDQTISTYVATPFFASAVTIAKTSCARSVTFNLAIADFCSIAKPSTTATDEEVLYWSPIPNFLGVPGQPFGTPTGDTARSIPAGAPKFSDYDGYQDAAHKIPGDGWGSPATLKVTRNLTTNPLPAGCTGNAGAGDDIYVYPSAAQINKELPVWSGASQNGTNYWK
jgi:hypothetical protein